jgi:nucleotide-binding universal stress UspA family protein
VFLQVVEPASPVAAAEMAYATLHRREFERRVRDAERYLSVHQGKFRELGIDVRTHVSAGPVVEATLRVADRENADLVAVASRAHTGLPRMFDDSTAAGLLNRITRPFLVVHAQKGAETG